MDKYIRIMYIENGELKKILKEVGSVYEATEEIDKIVVLEFPITEFSFYHNWGEHGHTADIRWADEQRPRNAGKRRWQPKTQRGVRQWQNQQKQ